MSGQHGGDAHVKIRTYDRPAKWLCPWVDLGRGRDRRLRTDASPLPSDGTATDGTAVGRQRTGSIRSDELWGHGFSHRPQAVGADQFRERATTQSCEPVAPTVISAFQPATWLELSAHVRHP